MEEIGLRGREKRLACSLERSEDRDEVMLNSKGKSGVCVCVKVTRGIKKT